MSFLREIQDAATSQQIDLATLLRKCKVLAYRLGHEPLKQWTEQELNGYSSKGAVPEYRILRNLQSIGTFIRVDGLRMDMPVSLQALPQEFRHIVSPYYIHQGIATLESQLNSDRDDLHGPWPADLVAQIAQSEGWALVTAKVPIPKSVIAGILDTVRNRVLTFALEIEATAGDTSVADEAIKDVPQERVSHIFNVTVLGDHHNVITGSSHVSVNSHHAVRKGDVESLKQQLKSLGVPEDDVEELEKALEEDDSPSEPGKFGPKTSSWIGRMASRAASGVGQLGLKVAEQELPKLIDQYLRQGGGGGVAPSS